MESLQWTDIVRTEKKFLFVYFCDPDSNLKGDKIYKEKDQTFLINVRQGTTVKEGQRKSKLYSLVVVRTLLSVP